MILFLGVARALKAMHQYRVKAAPVSTRAQNKAKRVRSEAAKVDEETVRHAGWRNDRNPGEQDQEDAENEPLIEDEVMGGQEGGLENEIRAYAHRDIKPGTELR
jgi:serine/threonine kinase 16